MASLPQKSIKGTLFKKWAVESIDKLIDFLGSPFIQAGKGIAVRRSGGITIIELEKPTQTVQNVTNNTGGGGSNQDISATVSGNTASIALSGSTSSVDFVGTGAVSISGNTNGEIEINATGGTALNAPFPDLANPIESILFDVSYPGYAYPVWLIGQIGPSASLSSNNTVVCSVNFGTNGVQVYEWGAGQPGGTKEVPLIFPIPANTPFEVSTLHLGDTTELSGVVTSYPCIGQSPLADYTVTRASGNTNGTLFYGLSQQGDNTVSVDSSLDGTPLDFEGASVL